eukprot:8868256-Lingulodinium_polyedra.AAC.1
MASRRRVASHPRTTYLESVPACTGPGAAAATQTADSSPRLLLWTGPASGAQPPRPVSRRRQCAQAHS